MQPYLIASALAISAAYAVPGQPYPPRSPGSSQHSPWSPGHGGHAPHHGQPVTDIVDLGYSKYQGVQLEPAGILQWLGIRFAAPPLGNLRWRAPADPLATTELQSADQFQPTCLGYFGGGLSDQVNEDCLFLDVFAPANATQDSKLPVWFFIQGGGYAGDTDQNFNGTEVVMQSGYNMVFVQINYRVGAFGFLASEKVRQDGDLNVGLLDQRKALHWVQQYVHLFGGDPDHVVIAGDSAGAGSVAYQLTAYNGRDDHLFVGGIAESPFWPTHRTVPQMEFQFDRFAQNLSCPLDDNVMTCLRSKDTATLQASDVVSPFPNAPATPNPIWYFLPVVDGTFSTDYLYNLFEQGKLVRVPLMVGDDTNEGRSFAPNASTSDDFRDFLKANYPQLTEQDLDAISKTYPENGFGPAIEHNPYYPATAAAYGEATLICPGITMSDSLAKYNAASKTWNYRYNVHEYAADAAGFGVGHVVEKPAIYGPGNSGFCGIPCTYETYNAAIVPVVMHYWISFVLSLDPNTHKYEAAPEWQPWQRYDHRGPFSAGGNKQRLKFQTNATAMETVPEAQLQRCAFWKGLAEVTQQ